MSKETNFSPPFMIHHSHGYRNGLWNWQFTWLSFMILRNENTYRSIWPFFDPSSMISLPSIFTLLGLFCNMNTICLTYLTHLIHLVHLTNSSGQSFSFYLFELFNSPFWLVLFTCLKVASVLLLYLLIVW